ncbi:MAG: toll/interleukin-1 receptor domain-containing protein [Rhodobacter sp.]|nr:toll/interleukin-1 receptor domain-containing protein [Rhodobacter sp.]
MRPSERLKVISELSAELQARYTYNEIDTYLSAFGIEPITDWQGPNSKRVYSAELLNGVADDRLSEIAEDLEVSISAAALPLPRIWATGSELRLFVSHIAKDKDKAIRLRDCLKPYGVTSFVAHEDIEPTVLWQTEIERALAHMHCFLSVHTVGFSESNWTQQEIGFAVARRVKIISLKMGETPTGFIGKEQALPRRRRTAEEISKEIIALLREDDRTCDLLPKGFSGDLDEIPF